MFGKKTEDKKDGDQNSTEDGANTNNLAPPLKPFSKKGSHIPNKPPAAPNFTPTKLPRKTDIPAGPHRNLNQVRSSNIDSKKLIVGRAIELRGEITSCDHLIVEGYVEVSLPGGRILEVADTGKFSGTAEVEMADISGRFDGELTARDRLIVRATGRITGAVRYGRIVIESGGEIAGDMKTLDVLHSTEAEQGDEKQRKASVTKKKAN
jgi:cytoskeletal protein CcmA (bactofilin family)